ncbi:MAG TPA: putative zinc-binding peptidase [Pseudolabrys sp.]|jgi:hypothetical protein|nr:putative zinc-binding peptidase [Pseudolabrys sp.]
MRLFECQACGQPLYFENAACGSCGRPLGYLPNTAKMSALELDRGLYKALAHPETRYITCANRAYESCNWLIPVDSGASYCLACRHNRTIPDLSDQRNLTLWRRIEVAKHRLFYSILRLRLPLITKMTDPTGLAFDFLAPGSGQIMTGHIGGVITINLSEADDSEREKQRGAMGEPYRTLLGHFRHEVAHYYWDRIVRDHTTIANFREVFGDERADYDAALKRHYSQGAPPDWPNSFVTAYASSHPWEDFAETWAHYFHIVDTLETARAFRVETRPRVSNRLALEGSVNFDPYAATTDRLIDAWLPLTFAFNSINRSMGLNDLYPFLLSPWIIVKLAYICNLIQGHSTSDPLNNEDALRAIVVGLKKGAAAPA